MDASSKTSSARRLDKRLPIPPYKSTRLLPLEKGCLDLILKTTLTH